MLTSSGSAWLSVLVFTSSPSSATVRPLLLARAHYLQLILAHLSGSIFIAIAHASQRSTLGSSNGLAQMCASAMRGVGPALITSLWAWSMGWLQVGSMPGRDFEVKFDTQMNAAGSMRWPAGSVFVVLELMSAGLVMAGTGLETEREPNIDNV